MFLCYSVLADDALRCLQKVLSHFVAQNLKMFKDLSVSILIIPKDASSTSREFWTSVRWSKTDEFRKAPGKGSCWLKIANVLLTSAKCILCYDSREICTYGCSSYNKFLLFLFIKDLTFRMIAPFNKLEKYARICNGFGKGLHQNLVGLHMVMILIRALIFTELGYWHTDLKEYPDSWY